MSQQFHSYVESTIPLQMTIFCGESEVGEAVVHLYLKLNGYFSTPLIVHSDVQGRSKAQIDALAVRHQFHAEPEREVECSSFLKRPSVDLLICEVKCGPEIQFNPALRENREVVCSVLRWAGLFGERSCQRIADRLMPMLQPGANASLSSVGVIGPRKISVRPLLCAPCKPMSQNGDPWTLAGDEIFGHIRKCVAAERATCSTTYNYKLWGTIFEPLVRYFKQPDLNEVNMDGLCRFLREEKLLKVRDEKVAEQPKLVA